MDAWSSYDRIVLKMTLEKRISRDRRLALQSAFLVANTFIWYFLAITIVRDIITNLNTSFQQELLLWGIHFGTLVISLIGGVLLVNKLGRRNLFVLWTLIGVISPIALLALDVAQTPVTVLVCVIFGVSAGLGMPNSMEYFKRSTNAANRGRYGGLVMLVSGLGFFVLGTVASGLVLSAFVLIAWRLFGLIGLLVAKPFAEHNEKSVAVSYRSILSRRSFILYIVPWLMFSLVNYLSNPIEYSIVGESTLVSLNIIGNAILGVSAIAAGFLMDYVGRKPAAIAGFVLLGLSYAVLGIYPQEIVSWYFYTILYGMAWGIFIVLFIVSIWGDLSQDAPSDRFYAIGVLPFFISQFLGYAFSYASINISPYALFSFIAFFLFLAILPLVYAPETLPEKVMKDRDLKSYVENAKKKARKEPGKVHKKEKPQNMQAKEKAQETENPTEYEDAVKLAEKYY